MGATKLVLLLLGLVSVALGFLPHPIPAAYEQFEPAISLRHHIHPTTRDYAFVQSKDSPSKEEKAVNGLRGLCGNHTQWIVKDSYSTAHNGIYHVYLRQTYQDLEIANRCGALLQTSSAFSPPPNLYPVLTYHVVLQMLISIEREESSTSVRHVTLAATSLRRWIRLRS